MSNDFEILWERSDESDESAEELWQELTELNAELDWDRETLRKAVSDSEADRSTGLPADD